MLNPYVRIDVAKTIEFFDEKPPNSEGHATAIVAAIGEDLGAALLQSYLERSGKSANIVCVEGKHVTPTLQSRSGPRLDRWMLVSSANGVAEMLLQIEIKNFSAHALDGKLISSLEARNTEQMAKYRIDRWNRIWNSTTQTFVDENYGKVLVRMVPPIEIRSDSGDVLVSKEELPRIPIEPVLCLWFPCHPDGESEACFRMDVGRKAENRFEKCLIFSMSNFLRQIGDTESTLKLRMPDASRRIEWLNSICSFSITAK